MSTATPPGMTRLRLKAVIRVSFCRSEKTNLDLFKADPKYPGDLKDGEAFMLVSMGWDQLIIVYRDPVISIEGSDDPDATFRVVHSRRLRLADGGQWNPMMLQNYAHEIGIHLIGRKRFEVLFKEQQDAKRVVKAS